MRLCFENDTVGGTNAVRVSGEIDMSNSPVLAKYLGDLVDNDRQDLELDLSGIEFMDSSGVAVLIAVHRRLEESGRRLSLVASSSPVTRVIEAVGLGEVFGVGSGRAMLHMVRPLAEPA